MKNHQIIIVDDHKLVSNSLKKLIESFVGFEVSYQFFNGKELINYLNSNKETLKVDLILLDVNMPIMNGLETIEILDRDFPSLKVLVLTMEDDETTILKMLKNGANGYILKSTDQAIFKKALTDTIHKGYYHTDRINILLLDELRSGKVNRPVENLTDNEIKLLQMVCSELTYKEIAKEMYLSPKTIDGYRDALFRKLNVKNRIGLVLFAIRNRIYEI